MLVKRGNSAVLDSMRSDILKNHPSVRIADADNFYDTSVFNECERMNCLMETLDIWSDIHPALLTLPVEWKYKVTYGIVYAKKPAPLVAEFIDVIARSTNAAKPKLTARTNLSTPALC